MMYRFFIFSIFLFCFSCASVLEQKVKETKKTKKITNIVSDSLKLMEYNTKRMHYLTPCIPNENIQSIQVPQKK